MCSLESNNPSGLQSHPKKRKKGSSCTLNSQHCSQERNEYNNRRREIQDRTSQLKESGLSRNMFEKDSEEILGKTNHPCSSNNVLALKLLNADLDQAEELVRAEILSCSLLYP